MLRLADNMDVNQLMTHTIIEETLNLRTSFLFVISSPFTQSSVFISNEKLNPQILTLSLFFSIKQPLIEKFYGYL